MKQKTLFEIHSIRSPLFYPGGKKKLIPFLKPYYDIFLTQKRICSPFVGGAAIELSLAAHGIQVLSSDHDELLVNFWNFILDKPNELVDLFINLWDKRSENIQWFTNVYDYSGIKQAAIYWIVNKTSFRGKTFADTVGCMKRNPPGISLNHIESYREFNSPNLFVEHLDYRDSLQKYKDLPVYLDPPYIFPLDLYGKENSKNFNHLELFELLSNRNTPFLLSYDNDKEIKNLYKDFYISYIPWFSHFGHAKNQKRFELLISNFKPNLSLNQAYKTNFT